MNYLRSAVHQRATEQLVWQQHQCCVWRRGGAVASLHHDDCHLLCVTLSLSSFSKTRDRAHSYCTAAKSRHWYYIRSSASQFFLKIWFHQAHVKSLTYSFCWKANESRVVGFVRVTLILCPLLWQMKSAKTNCINDFQQTAAKKKNRRTVEFSMYCILYKTIEHRKKQDRFLYFTVFYVTPVVMTM